MTNLEIAVYFHRLSKIMELHDENPFKIRSYRNAYQQLKRLEEPLTEMTPDKISEIQGVGKKIADKIQELKDTGELTTYLKYADKTPKGIVELLTLKGFGPKKIKHVWKELGVESAGELLQACNENRLLDIKGFGLKTQNELKSQLEYILNSAGQYKYAKVVGVATQLVKAMQEAHPDFTFQLSGELRRKMPLVQRIDIVTDCDQLNDDLFPKDDQGRPSYSGFPVEIHNCETDNLISTLIQTSSSEAFIDSIDDLVEWDEPFDDEAAFFDHNDMPYIHSELREEAFVEDQDYPMDLVEEKDVKGIVHCHTTYSDGAQTLEAMVQHALSLGYEYIVVTDHSKSAFYANGLKVDMVYRQWDEIDNLQEKYPKIKIIKGIESDILNDGRLDYEDSVLAGFDVIIASIHSNLKMDEKKATQRLITAIQNPYTHILGHPTGRLLLSRKGYPINYAEVIDACAEHKVSIEMNSNPARLDMDWSWIPYAIERGVKISINPDAHSKAEMDYVRYGVAAARKGGLTAENCLNSLDAEAFLSQFA